MLDGVALAGRTHGSVVLQRTGRRGAWTDGTHIWIADTENGKVLLELEGYMCDEPDDSSHFRYMDGDEYVYLLWDTLEETYRSEYGGILSPDGKYLVITRGTEGFTLMETAGGEELWREGYNAGNTCFNEADPFISLL